MVNASFFIWTCSEKKKNRKWIIPWQLIRFQIFYLINIVSICAKKVLHKGIESNSFFLNFHKNYLDMSLFQWYYCKLDSLVIQMHLIFIENFVIRLLCFFQKWRKDLLLICNNIYLYHKKTLFNKAEQNQTKQMKLIAVHCRSRLSKLSFSIFSSFSNDSNNFSSKTTAWNKNSSGL